MNSITFKVNAEKEEILELISFLKKFIASPYGNLKHETMNDIIRELKDNLPKTYRMDYKDPLREYTTDWIRLEAIDRQQAIEEFKKKYEALELVNVEEIY